MFCRKCGSKINNDAAFCYKCGEEVNFHLDNKTKVNKANYKKKILLCILLFLIIILTFSYCIFSKNTVISQSIAGDFKVYWNDSREDLAGRYKSFKPVNPKNWDYWEVDSGIVAVSTVPVLKTNIFFKNDKLSTVQLNFDCHNPEEPPEFFSEEGKKMLAHYETYEDYEAEYEYEKKEYLRKCKINDAQCKKSMLLIAKKIISIYGEPMTKVENDMSSFGVTDQYNWDADDVVIRLTYSRDDDYTGQNLSLSFKSKRIQNKKVK